MTDSTPPYPCGTGDPRPRYYDPSQGAWLVQVDRSIWAIVTQEPDGKTLYVNANFDGLLYGPLPDPLPSPYPYLSK